MTTAILVFISLILAGNSYGATISPTDAINLAGKEAAARAAKQAQADAGKAQKSATSAETSAASAAVEVNSAQASLEQWRVAAQELIEANAKKAGNDQATNQRYAFWGNIISAFGVVFMGILIALWKGFSTRLGAQIALLPQVVRQLSLISPMITKLEVNTNSLVEKAEAAAKKEGIAEEKERQGEKAK